MKIAVHFEIELGPDETESELQVVRGLMAIPPHRRHIRVYRGIIGPGSPRIHDLARLANDIVSNATVATIDAERLGQLLSEGPFVFVIDGITLRQASSLNERLASHSSYAGLVGLDDRVGKHWVVYQLPPAYRLIGNQLRVQHTFDALEGDPEEWHARVQEWERRHLFESVVLENLGVQQTLFDPFDLPEQARRRAETANLIEDQLGGVGNDLLLRLWDLDPRLTDSAHAALTAFEAAETPEQRAQVALALRRLLERLANALFPPTEEVRKGRELGRAQYRNRLWAYVEDHTTGSRRRATISALKDVGARIDRLDEIANAGLHDEIDATGLQRLLIALVALVYDVLQLAPPPASVPSEPYDAAIRHTLSEMFSPDD